METKYGFTRLSRNEFSEWIKNQRIGRTVMTIQQHHTFLPDYSGFHGNNHFTLQKSMKDYHVNHNGWSDLGQHFTTFPDGSIVTGRSPELSPACIFGNNANSVCIENLGNFDINGDIMSDAQRETIIFLTAELCRKFSISPGINSILYHHWFNLETGVRNNGTGGNKSCPGSAFFGGNKPDDCIANFIPPVNNALNNLGSVANTPDVMGFAAVTAGRLNVRTGPGTSYPIASGREPITFGSVTRIYGMENGWSRISSSKDHWVSSRYTRDVKRGVVTATRLNARSGPDISYTVVGALVNGQEVFIENESGNWGKILNQDKWISVDYLSIQ
jgi:uncharacterized protein YraI